MNTATENTEPTTETAGSRVDVLTQQRYELAQIVEPADWLGMQLIHQCGVAEGHALLTDASRTETQLRDFVVAHQLVAEEKSRTDLIAAAHRRWQARAVKCSHDDVRLKAQQLQASVLIPEQHRLWPHQLNELGARTPLMLWVRGDVRLLPEPQVALVGSRASSNYGMSVTHDLAVAAIEAGVSVTSGGAYGIDAAAHQAVVDTLPAPALGRGGQYGSTVAVLAGGIDRYYPAGNLALLEQIQRCGALVTETLPGMPPSRHRFLSRNRIIAGLSQATVVVEAQYRSGAINTAYHALDIGRPLGVVPGSVYAPNSAGVFRLWKETPAEIVTGGEDLLQLLGCEVRGVEPRSQGLSAEELQVLDALPVTKSIGLDVVLERTGLAPAVVLGCLTRLVGCGLVAETNQLWRSTGRSLRE